MSDPLSSMQEGRLEKAIELTRRQILEAAAIAKSPPFTVAGVSNYPVDIAAIAQIIATNYQTHILLNK